MAPDKVIREKVKKLSDLPNIGPAMAKALVSIGFQSPKDIIGHNPYDMYQQLCIVSQCRQDPCVLDTLLSISDFLAGNPPQAWWHYTAQRKEKWPTL